MSDAPYPWQQTLWDTFTQGIASDRFGHAVMICGPLGMGKRVLGVALAAQLLCAKQTRCGECPACKWFAAGNHPDWHVLEPEEDKKSIQVDGVRALTAALALSSLAGGRKVALVEPADVMTPGAANSLLKTLEEPPGDSVLILVTSRPSRLPATILSRCQMHSLQTPSRADALAWLSAQPQDGDWPALLASAGGAPLAAVALAQAGFGEQLDNLRRDVLELLAGTGDPVSVAASWLKIGPSWCLDWLQRCINDVIRVRFGLDNGDLAHKFGAKGLPAPLDEIKLNRLFEYSDAIRLAQRQLDGPVNAGLIIETLLIPLAAGLDRHLPEAVNQ